jgi:hypothetical protein
MCVADTDGDGAPELVAAGLSGFTPSAGSQVVAYDGTAWSPLGGSFLRVETAFTATAAVQRIAAVDLGGSKGPALFATGFFNTIDGATVANIARWNGSAWTDVGGGLPGSNLGAYRALHGHDFDGDGSGELVGAGGFVRAGNALVNRLAAYDGTAWSSVGVASPTLGLNDAATTSVLFDHDGDGRASLVVGGYFDAAGATQASSLAAFDGASWQPIPNPGLAASRRCWSPISTATACSRSMRRATPAWRSMQAGTSARSRSMPPARAAGVGCSSVDPSTRR